ncbi:MAG: hypothetical protein ACRDL5_07810, partial [Solirubrobacteraceae bacterium]
LLASRLDALEADERSLMKAMSVFGGSFPRQAVLALTGADEQDVDRLLAGLVRKQVLVVRADPLSPERGQYAFAQGMLRAVAYESLSRRERKQRHLAAADHLRTAFAGDGEEVAEVIATHLLDAHRAAGDDPDADELRRQAVEALSRSARRASAVGAPGAARRAYEQAAEIADPVDRAGLLEAAGQMASRSGDGEAALALVDAAADRYARAGRERERALTAVSAARALIRLGRLQEAIDRVIGALDTVGGGDRLDDDVGRLSEVLGRALTFAGEHERAAPVIDTALRIAQAHELSDVLGHALVGKAMLCQFTGRAAEARCLYAGAIGVAREHDLGEVLDRAQANLGNLAMMFDMPDAGETLDAALQANRRRGNRDGEGITLGNLSALAIYKGRWEQAQALAGERLGGDQRQPSAELSHYRLAVLCALRGDGDGAERALGRLSGWADTEDPEHRSVLQAAVIATRLAQGHHAEALDVGLRMLPVAIAALGLANDGVRDAWPYALAAALELGRDDDAGALIALLADVPPGHVPPYLRAQLARGRALLAIAKGDHDTAEPDLQSAIAAFEKLAYPYWLAVARTDLAAALLDQERGDEATSLLELAVEALTSLGAAPALERARQLSRSGASRVVS